jgi:hypothetical protein
MSKILKTIVCLIAATTLFAFAEDATENTKTEKPVNAGTHPYLFFLEQNGEDSLIVYEQWAQKNPGDPSVLTVYRILDGKSDILTFRVKVEALKEGLCSFRIPENKIDDPTVTKAKELLGIKSDFFEIRFRETPGQMSKILLSVKDSDPSERVDADKAATAPRSEPSSNKAEQAITNPLLTLPQELIGRHHGAMGQYGQAAKDKPLSFGDDDITLGGIELKADGELIVPFALKGESFKDLTFKFLENHVSGAVAVWHPLQDGNDRYSATLSRYGSVFRVLVKLHREDGSVAAIQWICAEPREEDKAKANQELKAENLTMTLILVADTGEPKQYVFVINGAVAYKTLDGLKNYLKGIPRGSSLTWAPGCCRNGNEPLLGSEEEMKKFREFCESIGIKFTLVPSG